MSQCTEEGEERARPLVEAVAELAAVHDATPAQISLAWMLAKKPYVISIPSSRKPERLGQNLEAVNVKLTADEATRLDTLLDSLDLMVFGGHKVK